MKNNFFPIVSFVFFVFFHQASESKPLNNYSVKAPFGFKWGMSIDSVKKMDWIKKYNNGEFVCATKTGSKITKCTNSYAPSPLLVDGDYSLFFDPENKLFKVSFLTSAVFDSKEKKKNSYLRYKNYIDVLERKYGEADLKDYSEGFFYQWGGPYAKIKASIRNDHNMVYLEISYFSEYAQKIISDDNRYYANYEYDVL